MRICVYGFCFSLGLQECARMTIPYDDIKIAHFSGALSLAQWVLDPVLHNTMSFDALVQSRMLESFLAIVDKEKADEDAKGIVKLRLQHVTEAACKEWYAQYEALDRMVRRGKKGKIEAHPTLAAPAALPPQCVRALSRSQVC